MSRYKSSEVQPTESHRIQNTQRGSLRSLSSYLSVCLGFEERKVPRGNSVELEDYELKIEKCLVERALFKHFDDPSLKVLYFRFLTWHYLFCPRFAR